MSAKQPRTGRPGPLDLDRRNALRLLAGSMAFALSSCGPPDQEIVPYVNLPEGYTPGLPMYFATAVPLAGYAQPVMATSHEGRPTRLEGNRHVADSRGAVDIFAQAEIMTLYSPDRSQVVRHGTTIATWDAFAAALWQRAQAEQKTAGAGLRILTGRVTSPTLIRSIEALGQRYPQAQWIQYEPVHDDAARAGATTAFGKPLTPLPRLAEARIVVTLDADPLGAGPAQVRNGLAFSRIRQSHLPPEQFARLYAVESMWRLTGANADERLALAPGRIRDVAIAIARQLGADLAAPQLDAHTAAFAQAAATDLAANKGGAMVLCGDTQPAEVHALCHWINAQLSAPIDYVAPPHTAAEHEHGLVRLKDDIDAGRVTTLLIIDSNPAYASPAALGLGDRIAAVPFSAHLGLHDDETAARCHWHLPLTHTLEAWSDLRAVDGTVSIVQPLIRPLYDTRTALHLVGMLKGDLSVDPYDEVQSTWRQHGGGDFASSWRRWLHDGVVADTAAKPATPPTPNLPKLAPATAATGLALVIAPDPSLWDGRYANNAWLQECPKPITSEVWGNSLKMSPKDAAAHGVTDGDVVEIAAGGHRVAAPVHVQEGQAEGAVAATLGYGRTAAGAIGNGIGFDVYRLRQADAPWVVDGITLKATGDRRERLSTQHHFKLDGAEDDILRSLRIGDLPRATHSSHQGGHDLPTLLPDWTYQPYHWAMVIDTSLCIGCNACVIACQSENNVPVVGPDQISVGRDMHWLRVDTYFLQGQDQPPGFQPVPCMQCDHAPCEPVCPVEASVHDSEGLNDQVYNRCIGTRFCQSNCPYKVRRFNFFGYAQDQTYANLDADVVQSHYNPDVTVRGRGVMEKCTYCVQRISHARHEAERTGRPIPAGGVVTACQAACPTRAISFGNRNNAADPVNTLRNEPHHYAMLGHLGTKPSTTYLARLDNPSPALGKADT